MANRICLTARLPFSYSLLATRYSPLNPLDDAFAEQALRTEHQEDQRNHVGEPGVRTAAHQWAPVELGQFFADADDQPTDDRAGDRREAGEDEHRQLLGWGEGVRKRRP